MHATNCQRSQNKAENYRWKNKGLKTSIVDKQGRTQLVFQKQVIADRKYHKIKEKNTGDPKYIKIEALTCKKEI